MISLKVPFTGKFPPIGGMISTTTRNTSEYDNSAVSCRDTFFSRFTWQNKSNHPYQDGHIKIGLPIQFNTELVHGITNDSLSKHYYLGTGVQLYAHQIPLPIFVRHVGQHVKLNTTFVKALLFLHCGLFYKSYIH